MISWHTHHIVPVHDGGTDDPSNLLKCNLAMHAMLHKIRYDELGQTHDLRGFKVLDWALKNPDKHKTAQKRAADGQREWIKANPERSREKALVGARATLKWANENPELAFKRNSKGAKVANEYFKNNPEADKARIKKSREKRCRVVITQLGEFFGVSAAANAHGISYGAAKARAQRGTHGWKYKHNEDKQ